MSRKETHPTASDSGSNPLDEAMAHVRQVRAIVGEAPALTVKDRARSTKLRKGGGRIIPILMALSDQFGLTVASYPTKTVAANAKQAESLIPLHKLLVLATKQVEDQMFVANSESWTGATVHYTMLKRLARTNGDLAQALEPVRQFFASKSRAPKAEDAKSGAEANVAGAPVTGAASGHTAAAAPASGTAHV